MPKEKVSKEERERKWQIDEQTNRRKNDKRKVEYSGQNEKSPSRLWHFLNHYQTFFSCFGEFFSLFFFFRSFCLMTLRFFFFCFFFGKCIWKGMREHVCLLHTCSISVALSSRQQKTHIFICQASFSTYLWIPDTFQLCSSCCCCCFFSFVSISAHPFATNTLCTFDELMFVWVCTLRARINQPMWAI